MLKRSLLKTEILVGLVIVILSMIIGIINPAYFTIANTFDLLRSGTEMGIFALGVLIVIISGGIDVSFTAIAVVSMYVTTKMMLWMNYQGPVILMFLIGALIGIVLGLFNAAFISGSKWLARIVTFLAIAIIVGYLIMQILLALNIPLLAVALYSISGVLGLIPAFFVARMVHGFRLPTLIVTLGTQSLYRGFTLFFIGPYHIIDRDMPPGMKEYFNNYIVSIKTSEGTTSLHSAIFIFIFLAILVYILLKYTMLGRGIYALGGAPEAAERAGFNITAIQIFIYAFVGFLAGVNGIVHTGLIQIANPQTIVGTELFVIAAVVLGGASITGGRGSVIGTILGVALVIIMNNSLILMGVSSTYQRVVVGLIIIIGTGVPAYQALRSERRLKVISGE
ncbi:MAG: ABC transporter permease [Chloroflexota bacterium]